MKFNIHIHKQFALLLLVCFISIVGNAQSILTVEQAVDLALKNNFDIQLAKNEMQQTANNNNLGNAGMLPTLTLNASGSTANNATKQEFSNGLVVDKSGVKSQNINTGAYLSWTVFDGLKMFATHQRLKEMEAMGAISMKLKIENVLVEVMNSYYAIVKQKQVISGLKASIIVSEERLKIAQKKLEIGVAAKPEVLQAKLDLSMQQTSLIKQLRVLNESKQNLNQLMVVAVEQDFDVSDEIPLLNQYKYDELKTSITNKNSDLLLSQKNTSIAKYNIQETRAAYLPKVNLNANYIFSRNENQAGFSLLNQNLGLNLGASASWTIFNGFTTANNVKNAKLKLAYTTLQYESVKTQTQLNLLKAFKKHEEDLVILELEQTNIALAKENLDIAMDRFKLGQSTSIELKIAQQSYEDAINNVADARYNGKLSETQLLKLSGAIMK
jgi:outer membrane protein